MHLSSLSVMHVWFIKGSHCFSNFAVYAYMQQGAHAYSQSNGKHSTTHHGTSKLKLTYSLGPASAKLPLQKPMSSTL